MSEDDTGQARPHPWDFCERWARGLRDKGFPGVFAHIAGVLLVLLGVPTALMVISASLWLLWGVTLQILGGGVAAEGATSNPLTDFRGPALILAGALTAPFIIWRALIADRAASAARQQAETAQTTNITTRINEAVKMLGAEKSVKGTEPHPIWRRAPDGAIARDPDGAPLPELDAAGAPLTEYRSTERTEPNLEVRLGALYALERIAQDSLRDHVPIMETLCAYIRENSENLAELARPRIDILTALTILGRRGPDQRAQEAKRTPPYSPDLGGAKFGRNDLSGLALQGMLFVRAKMEGANLGGAKMEGADLRWAKMEGADLRVAGMEGAVLSWAKMEGADLTDATMEGADLSRAGMEGADLSRANMDGAKLSLVGMEGALLMASSFSSLDCTSIELDGAAVQSREESEVLRIRPEQAVEIFADGSVILPEGDGFVRPAHWCAEKLEIGAFRSRWRDWRERKNLPWPPPGRALAYLADHPATPFDSPVQPDELARNWTPPAQ